MDTIFPAESVPVMLADGFKFKEVAIEVAAGPPVTGPVREIFWFAVSHVDELTPLMTACPF